MSQQSFTETARDYATRTWAWYQHWLDSREQQQRITAASATQETHDYKGASACQAGIAQMQRRGWHVQSQSSYQPRAGCMRILMLGGIGALVFKPKPRFIVVFAR